MGLKGKSGKNQWIKPSISVISLHTTEGKINNVPQEEHAILFGSEFSGKLDNDGPS